MSCKNCQTPLMDVSDYCNVCGAKVIRNRLTIRNLLAHFSEHFLDYDNRFLQTFIYLFKAPEQVIDGYSKGLRKKFADPVSYFAIAVTLIGLQMFVINRYFPDGLDISALAVEGSEEASNSMMKNMLGYQSLIFMINVPIYAFMSLFVFLTLKRYNYTEYLLVFLYTVPQVTFAFFLPQLILMALGFTIGELSYITIPFQVVYTAYCFKRIFKLSLKGIILRTLFFILVLGVMFVIFSILYLIIMYFTGGLQEMIEAQRALEEASEG